MAALDFPSNPTNGQTYALNGVNYYYNSTIGAWLTQTVTPAVVASSNTQVMFNDAGIANGSPELTFNKVSSTLNANTISVGTLIEFSQNISYNYTITTGRNALSAGPVSIANGNVVTIPSGSVWTVT
jgi:hypothetical protein